MFSKVYKGLNKHTIVEWTQLYNKLNTITKRSFFNIRDHLQSKEDNEHFSDHHRHYLCRKYAHGGK